ncbi:MAG TPA: ABC transporter permease [Streptosporangiaceae bacterium]|nr:ABC transporter permease [Streptosporangiaceae bacterium]
MRTLTGTRALIKLALRRDRNMLVIWLYVLTAFVAATVYGFRSLYPNAAARETFIAAAGTNPALLSLYGPLYGNSLGSLTAWRVSAFLGLGAALMSIFLVIRHTRADEESGRLELIGAAAVGRHAPLACAVAVAWIANLVIGMAMSVAAIALGLPVAGSITMVAGIVGCGLAFAGVAAVTAQLAQSGRTARGLALCVLLVAFLLRATGDSAGPGGARWLSWLSPVGWAELDRAFGTIRWWVLVLPVLTALVVTVGAAVLAANRDYDAGLIAQRPGSAVGSPSLASPLALAWRLQRGSLLAWIIGAFVYGGVIGSAAKGIGGLLGSAQVRRIIATLGGQTALTNAYLAAILSFTGLIAAGYAIGAVLRLQSEESAGHADSVLATATGRIAWSASHLVIAAVGTVVIVASAGLGAGLGFTYRSGGGGSEIGRLVAAGLAQAPAALVLGGLAVALFGLLPRFSVSGSWSVLGVLALLLFLGATLQLSHWIMDVSPFTHLPKLPGGTVHVLPLVLLGLIAVALTGAGLVGLRRRDLA